MDTTYRGEHVPCLPAYGSPARRYLTQAYATVCLAGVGWAFHHQHPAAGGRSIPRLGDAALPATFLLAAGLPAPCLPHLLWALPACRSSAGLPVARPRYRHGLPHGSRCVPLRSWDVPTPPRTPLRRATPTFYRPPYCVRALYGTALRALHYVRAYSMALRRTMLPALWTFILACLGAYAACACLPSCLSRTACLGSARACCQVNFTTALDGTASCHSWRCWFALRCACASNCVPW